MRYQLPQRAFLTEEEAEKAEKAGNSICSWGRMPIAGLGLSPTESHMARSSKKVRINVVPRKSITSDHLTFVWDCSEFMIFFLPS